ncbi:ATP-binding protein [Acrocarpospora catenulata]|uniref:ATP-binding protein n=1 Tax=Acrocarpospora catenulata TaxID=2836182 RepID=UPI001BD95D4E|nr:AAA family ATPase [Acrocarpospora catenulata]
MDELIGRDSEVAGVVAALDRARLVTVTGPPGVGKTALARRVGELIGGRVTVVDLDQVGDLSRVTELPQTAELSQVAELPWAAGLSRMADLDSAGDLVRASDLQQSVGGLPEVVAGLLVVDGCERLLDEVAPWVGALMQANPGLRVLAASRQSLSLPGEHVMVLGELTVPDRLALLTRLAGDAASAEVLAAESARFDGLPLTVELLAAALRRGTLVDPGCLDSLTDPARGRSLRAAIDAAHRLCTPAEQLLWARASAFAGCFDLDAVREVCGGPPLDADEVLTAVAGLVDKSVLLRMDGLLGVRFRLVGSLRVFGGESLARLGKAAAVRERHFRHFLGLARQAEVAWQEDQVAWYRRIRAEAAEFGAALEWRLADPGRGGTQAQDLAGSLWFLWACCGLQREGAAYLDRALALPAPPGAVREKALLASGWLHSVLGDMDAAAERVAQCAPGPSAAQLAAGVAAQRGDLREALQLIGEARAGYRRDSDLFPGFVSSYAVLGTMLLQMGNLSGATTVLHEGRELCASAGESWTRSCLDHLLAQAHHLSGDTHASLTHARSALRTARLFDDVAALTAGIELIGAVSVLAGDPDYGAPLLATAASIWGTSDPHTLRTPVLATIATQAREKHAASGEPPQPSLSLSLEEAVTHALLDHLD